MFGKATTVQPVLQFQKFVVRKRYFWRVFRPVAAFSVVGGFLQCPVPANPADLRLIRRWPAVCHVLFLSAIVTVFVAYRLPPKLTGVSELGSTQKTSLATDLAMNMGSSWVVFAIMQSRHRAVWRIVFGLASVDVQLRRTRLRRWSVGMVLVGSTMILMRAMHPVSDAIADPTGRDLVSVLYIFVIGHCAMPVYVLLTQVAFLAVVLCQVLKEINRDISMLCDYLCAGQDFDAKVRLQELSTKLWQSYDLVEDISKVYGVPMLISYLIVIITLTNTVFGLIMTGFEGQAEIPNAFAVVIVTCEVSAIAGFTIVLATVPENAHTSLKDLIKVRALERCHTCEAQVTGLIQKMNGAPVQISAANFFSINRSLLTAISGAVTTYIIVLAQFKVAEDGKTAIANHEHT